MLYMLDTNICIYLMKKKSLALFEFLENLQQKGKIAISSIVLSELQFGVANSTAKEKNQNNLDQLLGMLQICSYGENCAFYYGEIRAELKKQGCIIGSSDLFIASHAVAENAFLVTNNIKEFSRIKILKTIHWKN